MQQIDAKQRQPPFPGLPTQRGRRRDSTTAFVSNGDCSNPRAQDQAHDDRQIRDVKRDADQEGGLVGASQVEDSAAEPGPDAHADAAAKDHHTGSPSCFRRRQELAHDHRIAGKDAAISEPK